MDIFDMSNGVFSDTLYSALALEGIAHKRENSWDHYEHDGTHVPRVSEILKECIGREYLMRWAAKLGPDYSRVSLETLATGTLAHEMIEDFILHGDRKLSYNVKYANWERAIMCYKNFVTLWYDLKNRGYNIKPIFIEKQITTPFYGGTIDACFHIEGNGVDKTYLMDFKSSQQISFEYFIQLMFYYIAIEYNREHKDRALPRIDGIGVIRIDKFAEHYEYVIADNQTDGDYLRQVEAATYAMLNWFYHSTSIQYAFRMFKKGAAEHGDLSGHR